MSLNAESVLGFVLTQLHLRHTNRWLGARRSNVTDTSPKYRNLPTEPEALREIITNFQLKGVALDSQLGLLGWVRGEYPLILRNDIPTPLEMLEIQCEGKRYVTWLREEEDLDRQIGRHKGALAFLLHDLEHAHKFFAEPLNFRGQVSFFNLLRESLPAFEGLLADPLFQKDFDYLMSDMNSHPAHLFKYLKAIAMTASLRREQVKFVDLSDFWGAILKKWQMPGDTIESALRINNPGQETPEDVVRVSDFFVKTGLS